MSGCFIKGDTMKNSFLSRIQQLGIQIIENSKRNYITNPTEFRLILEIENCCEKYDGKRHSFQVMVAEGCEIQYSFDREVWSSQVPIFTDVCDVKCYIRVTRNKRIEETVASIKIVPRSLVLISESAKKEYDGFPLIKSDITILGDGIISNDKIICKGIGKQTVIGNTINKIEYEFEKPSVEKNYKIELQEGILSIIDRNTKYTFKIKLKNKICKYDGKPHRYAFIMDKNIVFNGIEYHVFGLSGDIIAVDTGEYTPIIKGNIFVEDMDGRDVSEQFDVTFITGHLQIQKRNIIITSGSAEKEYDGLPITCNDTKLSGDGLLEKDRLDISTIGTRTLIGSSVNEISYYFADENMAKNYRVNVIPGLLTVVTRKKKYLINLKGKSENYIYDGIVHSLEGFEENSFIINGHLFLVSGLISAVSSLHVGKINTEISGTPVVTDENGNDVTEQFDIRILPGTLCILPRKIKMISGSARQSYNGSNLVNLKVDILGEGFCSGEEPLICVSGKQCTVGKCNNVFSYSFPEHVCQNDYSICIEYGILEVIDRENKYEIDIHMNNSDILYDGKEHIIKGIEESQTVINDNIYYINADCKPKVVVSAGVYTYDEDVSISIYDSENRNVSEQFQINIIPGIVKIRKRVVTLTSENLTKEYDGIPLRGKRVIITGDGFAEDEGIETHFDREQLLPGTTENEFAYIPYENTDLNNYEIKCVNGFLIVTDRIKPFEVTVCGESKEYLYDGEEKTLPEFSDLHLQINGYSFFVTGVTNIVSATEEGSYTNNEIAEPCIYDAFNNDVSGQFHVSVVPGVLIIQHNPEFDKCCDEDQIDEYDIAIHEIIQKMSGDNYAEKVIKKYNRKELEALYRDTKELLKTNGTIDPKYQNLLHEKEEVDVMSILHNRIVKEFQNVTLLSEIEINDREFDLLMYYFKKKYLQIKESFRRPCVDVLFSVAMVQIGIRYYENNFWPQVAKAADIVELDQISRGWVGGSVTETLLAFGKPVYSKNEYVTNVMMHCFITDAYAGRFFDYLFQYYRIDMERDISGLQDLDLEYICESIINPYSKRKQLLSEYTAMSIRAAKEYCKNVIINTLKMIDHSFWDEDYEDQYLTGRLEKRFEEWKTQSDFYQIEKRKNKKEISEGKCTRQFRAPHLECCFETGNFNIILPSQMIPIAGSDEIPDVRWFIVSRKKWDFQCSLSDGYSGYKTEEICIPLEPDDIFYKYVFLLFSNNVPLRSFMWDEKKVQFFTSAGKCVGGEHLEPGRLFAFGSEDSCVQSIALLYEGREFGIKYYELNLHENDFVCVQGEDNYYVGQIPKPGLSDINKTLGLTISSNDKEFTSIPVYSECPELIIEMEEEQYHGTAVIVNGTVNKLSQIEFVDVHAGKSSERKYYFIYTGNLQGVKEGYNKILVDYPKTQKRLFVEYYKLSDFSFEFIDSPYIFKEHGILRVNRKLVNDKICLNLIENVENIIFDMSELTDGVLNVSAWEDFVLHFEIPMLLVSWNRKEWQYKQLEDIWHANLEDIIYIRYPAAVIALYVDSKNGNISKRIYKHRADEIFDCDLTKFKSYFSKTKIIEKICMEVTNQKIDLFKIIQKSCLVDVKLSANLEAKGIEAKLDILGKSNYFVDLYCEDILLVEKEPVPDNMKLYFDIEVDTADYTVKIYESEEDFSFDEEYEFVGEKTQALVNPADLIGGCMRIKEIRTNDMHSLPIAVEYAYYLFLEKQISCNSYEGILTAVFHKMNVMYASKANIEISDINKADTVRIKRKIKNKTFDSFVYDSDKEAILDANYMYGKKDRYTILEPSEYFCAVEYVSPNTKKKKESYEWIENKEKNSKRKFSIWKD